MAATTSDASPISNVSVSSDDEIHTRHRTSGSSHGPSRRQGASSAMAPPGGSPAAATPKEQQLIELLSQAAAEIRAERAKVRHLEDQLQQARRGGSAAGGGGAAASAPSTSALAPVGSMPAMVMRQKIADLALENFVAVQQIADLRMKVSRLEATIAEQALQLAEQRAVTGGAAHNKARHDQPRGGGGNGGATSPVQQRQPRSALRGGAAAPQLRSRTTPGGPLVVADDDDVAMEHRLPPPTHRFDPMASVQRAHSPTRPMSPAERRSYNEVMINRLRRAIAPPPTKEQLGEIVHAMLQELVKQLAKHGAVLSMKRVDHCVYQCGKRKLHLTVDSNRLVVKAGGGHVDLLEHIERNKLCTKAVQS